MLRKQLTVLGTGCFLAMSVHSALALSNPDRSLLTLDAASPQTVSSKTSYIVQLRGEPAAVQSSNSGIPNKEHGFVSAEKYDQNSLVSMAYRKELADKQNQVMASAGVTQATYTYEHSFNGFAAVLTEAQVSKLRSNPDVINIWPNEILKLDTANTPAFLGLTDPGGLHSMGVKGEDVIIGIVDTGIWPEHASIRDDVPGNEYDDIATTRPDWSGECVTGTDPEFSCNNKLIGARYFNDGFGPENVLPGEFDSPRDADGHGTHTLTTAGGNENTTAVINGVEVGTVSGIAPRARVAAYKVCWNGSTPGNSGCSSADSVAAIDAATADGVDVINFSISGSRTAQTDPVHVAFFNAAQGGVFGSLSAGNSGPGAQTVAHNVPWVTTVGASTYDGEIALIGNALEVSNDGSDETLFSIPGAITTPIPDTGLAGDLMAVEPLNACGAELDMADGALAGKIAYIARGTCAFSEKILNAQDKGAIGVVVYSDNRTPTAMGGAADGITIPGVMITNADGVRLLDDVQAMQVSVTMTNDPAASTSPSIGNQMAGFSSRGESLATADIIKPDITAPGVSILAGTTASNINGSSGESFAHLSGTSMSAPHISGIAALVREVNPAWSPSAIKSAIMTTARQNVVDEDGSTPSDPFDFGAGHVVPNSAVAPGIVYDASEWDYWAYLCGQGEESFVVSSSGYSCAAFENAGYPLDASDLNIASIAIAELSEAQTVTRYVTNVSNSAEYTATVEAPAGVDVTVEVIDWSGDAPVWVASDTMGFNANGLGLYRLTLSHNDDAVIDEWSFGAITWTDGTHSARSPIAVKPVIPPSVNAPASVSVETSRSAARLTLPVEINYNGRFFAKGMGLDAPDVFVDTVAQDPDSTFAFNEPGLGFYFVNVPEGTRIAKFGLSGADQASPFVDLDLYVYACTGFSCGQVGTSLNGGSDEKVVLVDPVPKADLSVGDTYLVFVHGWSLDGAESVQAPLYIWTVDESAPTGISVRASTRAVEGRTNRVYVGMSGLQGGTEYVGGVVYKDQNGDENGLTVIEVKAN
ncbi:S8 family serine peptidase [Aliiglaciecola litoralis]|uniref:Peptidase inhibitor I9 n=1 Tax=Aliiglaciecola litoralis TaxID=582857 RepID=A0ABN1LMV4_9ALTE